MDTIDILIIFYTIWAIYSGWKFTTRKIPKLNTSGIGYKIGKIIVSVLIGYVFGSFFLLVKILMLLGFLQKNLY